MTNNVPLPELPVRISSIQRFSLHDGPGIRTTVFLQGCPLHCPWCANPETQDPCGGKTVSVEEIMATVLRDADYYRNSGGGVTFSGGEPFMQSQALTALLKASKAAGLHTAVETSGEFSPAALVEAEPFVDMFLFDIKHVDPRSLEEHTGGRWELILQNLKELAPGGKVIGRIPCIPGFNFSEETMGGIINLARSLGIREVHLLPYHTFAKSKYDKLGRVYPWPAGNLRKEDLEPIAEMCKKYELSVRIGG